MRNRVPIQFPLSGKIRSIFSIEWKNTLRTFPLSGKIRQKVSIEWKKRRKNFHRVENRHFFFPLSGKVLWFGFLLLGPLVAGAASPLEQAKADLEAAREELRLVREQISAERATLAREHETAQMEVRQVREDWRDMQRVTRHREAEQIRQRRSLEQAQAERRSLLNLLVEFRRAMDSEMSPAERQRYAAVFAELDERLAADAADAVSLTALEPTLELVQRLRGDRLPRPFAGSAVASDGRVHEGEFLPVGPVTYFRSPTTRAGVVIEWGQEPGLWDGMDRRTARLLDEWAAGDSELVPVDVSEGTLLRMAQARLSIWERIRQGGLIMVPLLLIAVACVIMAVRRAIALRGMDLNAGPVLDKVLATRQSQGVEAARAVAEETAWPWREVLVDAVNHADADQAYLEEILQDRIILLMPRINQYLGALAICAAAAPLLGLLGTVTGMIHTFQLITVFGTGDARSLSGGISEALITTQAGLMIAVPTLLVHAYLARRAKQVISGLEQVAIRFVREK